MKIEAKDAQGTLAAIAAERRPHFEKLSLDTIGASLRAAPRVTVGSGTMAAPRRRR